jgi:hypothetical protein
VAIGNNETGFDGSADATYRIQGWDFLFAGGALYNSFDYSFAVGHEAGDFDFQGSSPGGGSAALRTQLGRLNRFVHDLPLIRMAPDRDVVTSGPGNASVRVLSLPGRTYALYLHRGRVDPDARPRYVVDSAPRPSTLTLVLPAGAWTATWTSPATGDPSGSARIEHAGGDFTLQSPDYAEDLALVVNAT